jgi:hypothetical protein
MVAMLMAVLVGMAALAVDVGHLFEERRQLQNGADAGALAVAEDCSEGDCGAYTGTAGGLAEQNALDDLATLEDVTIDMTAQTVEVAVSTLDAKGGSKILHWFAPIFGREGDKVHASATALWGALDAGKTLPLAISQCEWTNAGGTTSSPPTIPTGTRTFSFHDGNSDEGCNSTSGSDLPGGFGWLDTEGSCETKELKAGEWAESNPGASPPRDCDPSDFIGKTVLIPVFSQITGSGNTGEFRIWGFATFEITGMRLLMGNSAWEGGDISSCSTTNSGTGPGATETAEVGISAAPGGNGGGNGGGPPVTTPTTTPSTPGGGTGNDQACIVGEFKRKFRPTGVPGTPGSTPDLGTEGVVLID